MTEGDRKRKSIMKREAEMRWLWENEKLLWEKYAGQWVAVHGSDLVGAGRTPKEALEKARKAGYPDPLLSGVKRREYQGVPLVRQL